MSITEEEFGQVLQRWKKENSMPWGRLRYDTSRMNIARHTDEKKLRILDVGGGDGMDAIYYAKKGHTVTLADCSTTMLSEAKMSAEKQGLSGHLRFLQTEPDSLPDILDEQSYDLILCHMMIEFVPDSQALLSEISKLLVTGGLISIIDTNRYSEVYLKAFQLNNLSDALEAMDKNDYFHPWVNRLVPRFSAYEIIDQMAKNGIALVGHYGVLNLWAYLPNEPKFTPKYFNELKELEYQVTDQYPYYLLARFFQVIGQKS